jgi:hypothetical protein
MLERVIILMEEVNNNIPIISRNQRKLIIHNLNKFLLLSQIMPLIVKSNIRKWGSFKKRTYNGRKIWG